MKLLLRVLLLLACLRFAIQALVGYAFDFRDHGYPLWPLLALGISFAGYAALCPRRPRQQREKQEATVAASEHADDRAIDHAFLFLVLAIITSAFLLDKRGESPLSPVYFVNLSILTLFQLLIPYILTFGLKRGRSLATMVTMLVLTAFLVDGTMKDPEPITRLFQESGAYASPEMMPSLPVAPIPITPPGRASAGL